MTNTMAQAILVTLILAGGLGFALGRSYARRCTQCLAKLRTTCPQGQCRPVEDRPTMWANWS